MDKQVGGSSPLPLALAASTEHRSSSVHEHAAHRAGDHAAQCSLHKQRQAGLGPQFQISRSRLKSEQAAVLSEALRPASRSRLNGHRFVQGRELSRETVALH